MTRWYRAYVGTVSDDKLAEVALVAETSRCVAISVWHAILESAAADNNHGSFSTTSRRVAATLQERCETVEPVFAAMQELKMIADSFVCGWTKRQFESDSSTERSKKHREIKKQQNATLQQRHATPPESESESYRGRAKALPTHVRERALRAADDFEKRFWPIWPHKVGKPDAARAFLKVADQIDAILAGVDRYIANKPPDRPWLNPSTFLNQRRWEDIPAEVQLKRVIDNGQSRNGKRSLVDAGRDLIRRFDDLEQRDGPKARGWPRHEDVVLLPGVGGNRP